MSTPNDLSQIRAKIREIEEKSADGDYIYRGEPESHQEHPHCGKVSSSLWREYGIEKDDFYIEVIQKEMLNNAKKHTGHLPQNFRSDFAAFLNIAEKDTEEIINFEILTEIQHYGGKTNLIDFTTDYFIALFFACDGYHDIDGRVILQKTEDVKNMINHPRNPRHRIIAQKSVFVRPPKGYLAPREDEIAVIPANLKKLMLQHLRKYHGIFTETIYNDLHGYIKNQHIHGGAYTHFYRGFACFNRADKEKEFEAKQKEFAKSIEYYTKAIELNPYLTTAYFNRGLAHTKKSEHDRAILDFSMAIELKPDYAEAYCNRGWSFANKGEDSHAILDYNRSIVLKPDYVEALCYRGWFYCNKGEYDHAIVDYCKAIELRPDYAYAFNSRGWAYDQKGDSDSAIADFTKAIQLKPNDAETYNNRGLAYYHKRNFDHALRDFDAAIQLSPSLAQAHHNRGEVWLHLGNWANAKSDLTIAKNMGYDITTSFQSVENFEQLTGIRLPSDITDMLTPRQDE